MLLYSRIADLSNVSINPFMWKRRNPYKRIFNWKGVIITKRLRKILWMGLCILSCILLMRGEVEASSLYGNPNVTFSPDGKAFTTNAGETEYTWYEEKYRVYTGVESTLEEPGIGEHYYDSDRTGNIPIAYWKVHFPPAKCIHGGYPEEDIWHGIKYGQSICHRPYNSGWWGVCADCDKEIKINFYMTEETAKTIKNVSTDLAYYFLCPHCNNLEMGAAIKHECQKISWNQYQVKYEKNMPSADGFMNNSTHMYNNETEYNGKTIIPQKSLSKSKYSCVGYTFTGWNTKPDGSGQAFTDGQEILNLSTEDKGVVVLYAQWTTNNSTLSIDANGGTYNGKAVENIKRPYNDSYTINMGSLTAPAGYTVSFQPNGGASISPITASKGFQEWQLMVPFHGSLEENVYTYKGANQTTDVIKAIWKTNSIVLPNASKGGSSFGGWYYNPECSEDQLAGKAGESIVPGSDITLYAKWVDLLLNSQDNYAVNGGKGAVDLSWSQNDGNQKVYMIYQSRNRSNWSLLSNAEDITNSVSVNQSYSYNGKAQTFTAPYAGIYTISAYGAQGGNYGSYSGGKGGLVSGDVYLSQGEKVTLTIGGQDGYNGGGSATDYGNGGGATTVVTDKKGCILIAGGGGGAISTANGYPGGGTSGLVEGASGEDGMAGGGGGHQGGGAGEYILHTHTADCLAAGTETADNDYYSLATVQGSKNIDIGSLETSSTSAQVTYWINGQVSNGIGECTLQVGNGNDYFVTEYPGTLSFDMQYYDWGSDGDVYEAEVRVYAKDGTQLLVYDVLEHLGEPTKNHSNCNCGKGIEYSTYYIKDDYFDGYYESKPNYQHSDSCYLHKVNMIKGSFCLEIPEETEGIYVEVYCRTYRGQAGTHPTIWLNNLKYEYSYYKCGKTTETIEAEKPAYGGSNYINTGYVRNTSNQSNQRSGNGLALISGKMIGFSESLSMDKVPAPDLAAPDMVSKETLEKKLLTTNQVEVSWRRPNDNGTAYYHQAKSYLLGSTSILSSSNITRNILTSGVKGYYYLIDNSSSTVVNSMNGTFTAANSMKIYLTADIQYFHIATVDVAGNISTTTHIQLGKCDPDIAWPLTTTPIQISASEGIYQKDNMTWYVRADGKTDFMLQYAGVVEGKANASYMVNYALFQSKLNGGNYVDYSIYAPTSSMNGLEVVLTSELDTAVSEDSVLKPGASRKAVRNSDRRILTMYQSFVLDVAANGKTLLVVPRAGADFKAGVEYSNQLQDYENRIQLIGDGQAPVVSGTGLLENLDIINRNDGAIVVTMKSEDALSGVKEFYVEVENTDNFGIQRYTPEPDGTITLDITKANSLFSGNFIIRIYAEDNVGNVTEQEYATYEFALETKITRILAPHEPVFKCGESGILTVTTYGYAEKVVVEFPEKLTALNPSLNKEFVYTPYPDYVEEEQIQFMIPLDTPVADYTITVRAYKDGKEIHDYPQLCTIGIEGTVLDELKTRLR